MATKGCNRDNLCYWHSPHGQGTIVVACAGGDGGGDDDRDNQRFKFSFPEWREVDHGFMPANIVIVGHSFVRRLGDYLRRTYGQYFNMGLDFDRAFVTFLHQGGLTAAGARRNFVDHIISLGPDIVYIELGSNDLCHPRLSPQDVGDCLQDLANDLIQRGVHFVMLGQVVMRADRAIPRATRSYNTKVRHFNAYMTDLFAPGTPLPARFWRHRGMTYAGRSILGPDGVHLNQLGHYRLFRSIRGALLFAISRVRRHLRNHFTI